MAEHDLKGRVYRYKVRPWNILVLVRHDGTELNLSWWFWGLIAGVLWLLFS